MSEQKPSAALDRSDARVRHDEGISGALRGFVDRVRSGDPGMLPVVVGLVLIAAVFASLNRVFLAPNNLVNLLFDAAAGGLHFAGHRLCADSGRDRSVGRIDERPCLGLSRCIAD